MPDPEVPLALETRDDEWKHAKHVRPKVLRRETSQILSYYQSADAGRSPYNPEFYDCGARRQSPRSSRCSVSSSDSNYSDSETESISDYGSPVPGVNEGGGLRNENNGNDNINGRKEDEDGGGIIEYGIALGSPGGDSMSATSTAPAPAVHSRSGYDYDYGRHIITQSPTTHLAAEQPLLPQFNLSLHPTPHLHLQQQQKQTKTQVQSLPPPSLSVMDSHHGQPDSAPLTSDVPPNRRRRMSSRGASDKRRVAIVQVDSETDGSERERELELERAPRERESTGTISDGFGREPAHALFSTSSTSASSNSSHPPSSYLTNQGAPSSKSTPSSALLVRRGIAGTFAFVAPPDASPSAYTNLSYFSPPPLSAPPSAHPTPPLLARHESTESTRTSSSASRHQHQRSQSEAVLTGAQRAANHASLNTNTTDANLASFANKSERRRPGHRARNSSRDIGIVGTNTAFLSTSGTQMTDVEVRVDEAKAGTAPAQNVASVHPAQLSPIFQTPSRSETSLVSSDGRSSPALTDSRGQPASVAKESKRRSQHSANSNSDRSRAHTSVLSNGNGNGNGTAHRSSRDENISPVVVGIDPKQLWHAPSISSVSYPTYTASTVTPSTPHYILTSSSSPPQVVGMAAPAPVPSPYLYYQPGVHATAGPLPSPPRQILPPARDSPPPPRPPRLHAPNSGSSSLAKRKSDTSINSKQEHSQAQTQAPSPGVRHSEVVSPVMTPSTTSSTLVNSQSEDSVKSKGHTREGAFPISPIIVPNATKAELAVKQEEQGQPVLKRKNTMDELVKDVTAAIDEAVGTPQTAKTTSPPTDAPSEAQKEPSREQRVSAKRSGMDLKREESRTTFKGGETLSRSGSASSNYSDDDYDNLGDITTTKALPDSHAPSSASPLPSPRLADVQEAPISKPQKMLDFALKRFSTLPRPPSGLSATRASPRSSVSQHSHSHSHSQERSDVGHENYDAHERTQSQAQSRPKVVYVAKTKHPWPGAMQFGDVLAKRSPLERSLGYARKINELANYDPGLGDWVVATKHNLTVPGKATKRKSQSPVMIQSPSERSFTFQPRHPSRGSIGSEMTFPKRVDAYVATDLLQKASEDPLPQGPPPTLPYPSLAQALPVQTQASRIGLTGSMRSNPSSLGSGKSSGGAGGFFASIGRKTSVKKDRPPPVTSGSTNNNNNNSAPTNKLLSKRQQAMPAPVPRPVQINATPSLPGGPRAPPGRMQRAQSVIAPKVTGGSVSTVTGDEMDVGKRRSMKRSPSVVPAGPRYAAANESTLPPLDIEVQVGKLADLLPHADRKVLAGYLRRANGLDMVAIGRYLDDEKNGVLIRD